MSYLGKGDTYVGKWDADKRHGHGTFTSNAEVYDGEWVHDQRHGEGTLVTADKFTYQGMD